MNVIFDLFLLFFGKLYYFVEDSLVGYLCHFSLSPLQFQIHYGIILQSMVVNATYFLDICVVWLTRHNVLYELKFGLF